MNQPVVLSVGQCRPDGAAIGYYLSTQFGATVLTADLPDQALAILKSRTVDLVLINRLLDEDGSDGLLILQAIRQDPGMASLPVMLVSNYPEWQQKAVAMGAIAGFGKAELNRPETRLKLAAVLERPDRATSQPG